MFYPESWWIVIKDYSDNIILIDILSTSEPGSRRDPNPDGGSRRLSYGPSRLKIARTGWGRRGGPSGVEKWLGGWTKRVNLLSEYRMNTDSLSKRTNFDKNI